MCIELKKCSCWGNEISRGDQMAIYRVCGFLSSKETCLCILDIAGGVGVI